MRACACVTASRLCVRTVLCSSAFLLVPSSPSTNSAVDRSALFAGFAGTIDESDFFVPFIIGYGLRPSRCGPGDGFPRAERRSPGSRTRDVRTCSGSNDDAGWPRSSRRRTRACCLLHATTASVPQTTLLSPLNTSPVRPPVNASRTASRQCPAHDSGSVWIATHWDRNRARPSGGVGVPLLLFRLQDGITVPPWLTFPEAPL